MTSYHKRRCTSLRSSHPHSMQTIPASGIWDNVMTSRGGCPLARISGKELKSIVRFAELGLARQQDRGTCPIHCDFWHHRSWIKSLRDDEIGQLVTLLGAVKERLELLMGDGDARAADDHIWIESVRVDALEAREMNADRRMWDLVSPLGRATWA